jgi:hypothetical protein
MKKDPDPNSTDPAETGALIARLEGGELREGDAPSLGRLLRLLLRLIALLRQKNASLARLKRLLVGPSSDTRKGRISSPDPGTEEGSDPASSTSSDNASPDGPEGTPSRIRSRKGGHGRMGKERALL